MQARLVTIGVYGYEEEAFFQALIQAGVDTFCDIRQRRGVRGSAYAFANSQRLQRRLADIGIRYLHCRDLAPTAEVRQRQQEADKENRVAKRERGTLSEAFISAYEQNVLASFDPATLLADLPLDARVVALFCVEREPAGCHRSLVARWLQNELGWTVDHLLP